MIYRYIEVTSNWIQTGPAENKESLSAWKILSPPVNLTNKPRKVKSYSYSNL